MHEASLVQGLLDICLKSLKDHNKAHPENQVARIHQVECQLGLIACVEAQTLTACFELFAEGTPAEGAQLLLHTAPLPCRCTDCSHEFSLTQRHFVCPSCDGENIHFNGGHGLTLMALHVASEETDHD